MTKVVSFWGKGGVGKTTCAASVAVKLASRGFHTLLISSDPTPSLSDILEISHCPSITKVQSTPLYVLELSEDNVVGMWKQKYGEEVYQVISAFLPVDKSIIDYIAGAPGIADEFCLSYIMELQKQEVYDYIVWDTAPAGGTLKLLKLEEQFYKHLTEAAKLYLSIKTVLRKIRRKEEANPLKILDSWKRLAEDTLAMLSSSLFKAHIVAIPEWLSVAQTERLVNELLAFKVNIGKVVVNQVVLDVPDHLGKKIIHQKYLSMLKEKLSFLDIITVPLQTYEIRGMDNLLAFSEHLVDKLEL
ncbi:MAG: hypothetical protein DRJ33_04575 [Candidatus Methanomethylicota archaeon]|uniref:ArsA/GET3 Anion-transporting ATPase-like domain-containing protein n=1 Tax=Thermoproteota archaeon TaxID=2056631 RepID=A0A497EXZ9_9CREN|nr:MAG: hypothetical protein DRJ33_04575 [Candidatus Verstraetearchaeota archaeon]